MGTATTKQDIVRSNQRHDADTGSAEVQIALLTARITHLSDHFKTHTKDFASRRGLLQMVGKRSRLLKYLSKTAPDRYRAILAKLGLRK
ncbi:MAG: 30S ribosomal protein S15 [Planctomycetes bacterium]|nr:30S ribosomal protein S15 [Planctomycetota bacterium]